jgi:hypothetical protein
MNSNSNVRQPLNSCIFTDKLFDSLCEHFLGFSNMLGEQYNTFFSVIMFSSPSDFDLLVDPLSSVINLVYWSMFCDSEIIIDPIAFYYWPLMPSTTEHWCLPLRRQIARWSIRGLSSDTSYVSIIQNLMQQHHLKNAHVQSYLVPCSLLSL